MSIHVRFVLDLVFYLVLYFVFISLYTHMGIPINYTIYPIGYIFKNKYMYTYSYFDIERDEARYLLTFLILF